ncbi:MAG: DUF4198 domain-containing protein [Desulfobacterales bacterium]|nr:DUF4198 domain-containing protein [Desulfobacterales bacterium]
MNFTVVWILAGMFFLVSPAAAHYLWMNLEGQRPDAKEAVVVKIGWGHKFPGGEPMREGMLRRVFAVDEAGAVLPLSLVSDDAYRFEPKRPGVYRIYADVHSGFVSKTTEGYKMQPKNAVAEALSCFRYDLRAGTLLQVGGEGTTGASFSENPLEIVPLANPTRLKAGDTLPVKVLFNGVPLAGARIDATYAGYSEKADDFAVSGETGKEGTADIPISEKGLWLISASYELPYPDPAVCDIYRYKFSLTFTAK